MSVTYKFTYKGRLEGINNYTSANRVNPYKGNQMKHKEQRKVLEQLFTQLRGTQIIKPVILHYAFYEKHNRGKLRDIDNISGFAHKVMQDAMVEMGLLEDDNWNCIKGYTDEFHVDDKNPRIEVVIEEVD